MSQKNLNILSIDDKSITTDLDRAGYKKMGVTIKVAKNFQVAEELLSAEKIDIIVINFDYKEVNGLLLVSHFKSNSETKDIPIVLTSIRDKPKELKKLVKAGMDLFVEQPLPRQYFIEKLRNLLDQKTREDDRMEHKGLVSFSVEGENISREIGDLSRTGLLIEMADELPININIEMDFVLPGYKKPIKVSGTVVRDIKKKGLDERLGFGVRFENFAGDSQKRLERYLDKMNKDDPKLVYYL